MRQPSQTRISLTATLTHNVSLTLLTHSQRLEAIVVGGQRVGLPISLKLLSCCALAWPQLTHLTLSCMTCPSPPESEELLSEHMSSAQANRSGAVQSTLATRASQKQQQQEKQSSLSHKSVAVDGVCGAGWFVQPECLGAFLLCSVFCVSSEDVSPFVCYF